MKVPISFVSRNGEKIETEALINSGASGIFINEKLIQEKEIKTHPLQQPLDVFNVDRTKNKAGHIVEGDLIVKNWTRMQEFCVTVLRKEQVILGITWLEQENPDIDWKKRTLNWRKGERSINIYSIFKDHDLFEKEQDDSLVVAFMDATLQEETLEAILEEYN